MEPSEDVLAEHERCTKLCDAKADHCEAHDNPYGANAAMDLADAIRGGGTPPKMGKTDDKALEVHCPECGALVGRWIRIPDRYDIISAADFLRANGEHPEYGERIEETCLTCSAMITAGTMLATVVFNEQKGGET